MICEAQKSRLQGSEILIPRVSAHPRFLWIWFIWQISLCYLKKKNKKNQRQQHHRKRNFLSPFDFHSSALRAGLLTAETSRYASEGSVPLLLPPNRLHLPLLPHPQHPSSSQSNSSSSSTPPSPRGWPSLAPKVLQITFLNFRAEPGSDYRKKKKIQVPTEGGH